MSTYFTRILDMVKFVLVPNAPFVKGTFYIGQVVAVIHKTVYIEPSASFWAKFPKRRHVIAPGDYQELHKCIAVGTNQIQMHSIKKRLAFEERQLIDRKGEAYGLTNVELLKMVGTKTKAKRVKKAKKVFKWYK